MKTIAEIAHKFELKIAASTESHHPKTISERIKKQDAPTVPAPESEDEAKMYEDFLKMLEEDPQNKKFDI